MIAISSKKKAKKQTNEKKKCNRYCEYGNALNKILI